MKKSLFAIFLLASSILHGGMNDHEKHVVRSLGYDLNLLAITLQAFPALRQEISQLPYCSTEIQPKRKFIEAIEDFEHRLNQFVTLIQNAKIRYDEERLDRTIRE